MPWYIQLQVAKILMIFDSYQWPCVLKTLMCQCLLNVSVNIVIRMMMHELLPCYQHFLIGRPRIWARNKPCLAGQYDTLLHTSWYIAAINKVEHRFHRPCLNRGIYLPVFWVYSGWSGYGKNWWTSDSETTIWRKLTLRWRKRDQNLNSKTTHTWASLIINCIWLFMQWEKMPDVLLFVVIDIV